MKPPLPRTKSRPQVVRNSEKKTNREASSHPPPRGQPPPNPPHKQKWAQTKHGAPSSAHETEPPDQKVGASLKKGGVGGVRERDHAWDLPPNPPFYEKGAQTSMTPLFQKRKTEAICTAQTRASKSFEETSPLYLSLTPAGGVQKAPETPEIKPRALQFRLSSFNPNKKFPNTQTFLLPHLPLFLPC